MDIGTIIQYVNIGFLVVIFGIGATQNVRTRRSSFGYYAVGAAIYAFHIASLLHPGLLLGGNLAYPVETLALLILLLGTMREGDRDVPPGMVAVVFVAFLVLNVALYAGYANGSLPRPLIVLVLAADALFVAIPCAVLPMRPTAGGHYLLQGYMFLFVAVALSIVRALGLAPVRVDAVQDLAYAFGFFSFVMHLNVSSVRGALSAWAGDHRPVLFDMTAELIDAFHKLEATSEGKDVFAPGVQLVAEAMRDRLEYTRVFFGVKSNGHGRMHFDDCFATTSLLTAGIDLPGQVVEEVMQTRRPALIEDTANDPRIADSSLEQIGIGSFVVLPVVARGEVSGLFLVGGRPDASRMKQRDLRLFEFLTNHLSLLFSSLAAHGELTAKTEMDPVTLQRSYSSFQMVLTESLRDADKNGRTFAVVFVDVDHFAIVNEKCGYERADDVLRDIGASIARHSGAEEVGRVGPDEFAFLIHDAGEAAVRTEIEKLLTLLREDMMRACDETKIDFSVAFSMYPFDFFEQSGIFGKMREMLAVGSGPGRIVRVQLS